MPTDRTTPRAVFVRLQLDPARAVPIRGAPSAQRAAPRAASTVRLLHVPHAQRPLRLRRVQQPLVAAVKGADRRAVHARKELRVVHHRGPVEVVAQQQAARRELRPVRGDLEKGLALLVRRVEIYHVGVQPKRVEDPRAKERGGD
eukprot:3694956-Prymnesium_polylepis.1